MARGTSGPRAASLARGSLRSQHKIIAGLLARLGFTDRAARLRGLSIAARRDVPAFNDLTLTEATAAIITLGIMAGHLVQEDQPPPLLIWKLGYLVLTVNDGPDDPGQIRSQARSILYAQETS